MHPLSSLARTILLVVSCIALISGCAREHLRPHRAKIPYLGGLRAGDSLAKILEHLPRDRSLWDTTPYRFNTNKYGTSIRVQHPVILGLQFDSLTLVVDDHHGLQKLEARKDITAMPWDEVTKHYENVLDSLEGIYGLATKDGSDMNFSDHPDYPELKHWWWLHGGPENIPREINWMLSGPMLWLSVAFNCYDRVY